ncbi:hypothetical protein L7F22_010720 [Adiantum nelumboides]|nr:hypothetical protein [Adiantum nelumboides]
MLNGNCNMVVLPLLLERRREACETIQNLGSVSRLTWQGSTTNSVFLFKLLQGLSGDSSRNVVPEIVKNVVQRIGRPKRDSKQKTLDHYRVRRPRVDLNEDVTDIQGNILDGNMSQEVNVSDVEAIKTKESERSFLSHWSLKHKWAYPIFGFDGKQRAKCICCSEFGLKNPFAREGSSTMGIQALDKHANSDAHKIATQLWTLKSHRDVMPIQKHVDLMVDAEKQRIITVMQTMYFIVVKDMPLNFYYAQCEFMRYMRTPNMPGCFDAQLMPNCRGALPGTCRTVQGQLRAENRAENRKMRSIVEGFELDCILRGIQDQKIRLQLFKLCLQDGARLWFDDFGAQSRDVCYDAVKEAFLAHYKHVEDASDVWHQLEACLQKEDECVDVYAWRFSQLWNRWCVALRGQIPPFMLKKHHFVVDLRGVLKLKVECKRPQNYEDALRIAKDKEWKLKHQQAGVFGNTSKPYGLGSCYGNVNHAPYASTEGVHDVHVDEIEAHVPIEEEKDMANALAANHVEEMPIVLNVVEYEHEESVAKNVACDEV